MNWAYHLDKLYKKLNFAKFFSPVTCQNIKFIVPHTVIFRLSTSLWQATRISLDRGRLLDRSNEEREVQEWGVVHVHSRRLHPFLPHQPCCSDQNLHFEGIIVELHFIIRIPCFHMPNLQGRGILQGRRRRRWANAEWAVAMREEPSCSSCSSSLPPNILLSTRKR